MPYIARNHRPDYDDLINEIADRLAAVEPSQRKGHANYVITQILRRGWGTHDSTGESYSNYADIVGTLECAKLEIYRRWVSPYEDKAIQRNGDLD